MVQTPTLFFVYQPFNAYEGSPWHQELNMNPTQILGKATELLVSSILLKEGRELYQPVVDDHGVDLIVRTKDYNPAAGSDRAEHYEFQEIQVKSVSKGGLFAAMNINNPRPNYWFVFYIYDADLMWLFNSMDISNYLTLNQGLKPGDAGYIGASVCKSGSMVGKWSIDLTPTKRNPIKSSIYQIDKNFSKLP